MAVAGYIFGVNDFSFEGSVNGAWLGLDAKGYPPVGYAEG